MKWKPIKIAGVVVLSVAAVAVLACLDNLAQWDNEGDPAKETVPMVKDSYNGYGLPKGQGLAETPFYDDGNIIVYEDRVFRHFKYVEQDVKHTADVARELLNRLAGKIPLYVVPIPPRIALEDGHETDRQSYKSYISALQEQLPKEAVSVDVLPLLEEHKDEYIYFRTEDSWTAKGAYYGGVGILEDMGIEPFELEAYEEHMYNSFSGTMQQETVAKFEQGSEDFNKTSEMPIDIVYFYLLPDSKNRVEVTRLVENEEISIKSPAITKSGSGTSAFIGGDYKCAVVDGDGKNKEKKNSSLLMISDFNGQILAPFFANYYKNVIVVDVMNYIGFDQDFDEIIKKYNVEEVLYTQGAGRMGNVSYSFTVDQLLE